VPYNALSTGMTQQFVFFVSLMTLTFDIDIQTVMNEEPKHGLRVNLVPEIFEAQTKKSQTALKQNFTCVQ